MSQCHCQSAGGTGSTDILCDCVTDTLCHSYTAAQQNYMISFFLVVPTRANFFLGLNFSKGLLSAVIGLILNTFLTFFLFVSGLLFSSFVFLHGIRYAFGYNDNVCTRIQ